MIMMKTMIVNMFRGLQNHDSGVAKNKRRQIEGGIEGGGRNVVEGSDGLNAHLLKVAETC